LTARESLHSGRPRGRVRPGRLEIGGHNRRLAFMELGEAGLGIGVDEDRPIDPANHFQRAHGMCPARRKAQDIREPDPRRLESRFNLLLNMISPQQL
jgi:hypothetical protein